MTISSLCRFSLLLLAQTALSYEYDQCSIKETLARFAASDNKCIGGDTFNDKQGYTKIEEEINCGWNIKNSSDAIMATYLFWIPRECATDVPVVHPIAPPLCFQNAKTGFLAVYYSRTSTLVTSNSTAQFPNINHKTYDLSLYTISNVSLKYLGANFWVKKILGKSEYAFEKAVPKEGRCSPEWEKEDYYQLPTSCISKNELLALEGQQKCDDLSRSVSTSEVCVGKQSIIRQTTDSDGDTMDFIVTRYLWDCNTNHVFSCLESQLFCTEWTKSKIHHAKCNDSAIHY